MWSIVEIGSLAGRSSYALASGCKGQVWCVDPWDYWDEKQGEIFYQSVLENVYPLGNVTAVRGRSPDVAADLPDMDMVFIDGDHGYGSVRADIAAWLPKARKLICGHDYNDVIEGVAGAAQFFPGVPQAVDEVFGDRVTVPDRTAIWAVDLT